MTEPRVRILLVDDEPSIVKMVGKRLEIEGYDVVVAMDGEEALAKVKAERPGLVILDLMLPKCNGYEVCSILKKDPQMRDIPVAIFSAKTQDRDQQLGQDCGADAFICKPFKPEELMGQVKALLGRKPANGHARQPDGQAGFTLIELMLVIVIISALVAMVVPRLAGRSDEARVGVAKADIKGNLSLALRLYEVDNGRYPSSEQGLRALLEKPSSPPTPSNWKGPYIEQEPEDPWGKPYVYKYPGGHPPRDYDLYSLGPDGVESEDDVTNWK